ncbi:MAG: hypothetical protein ACFFG0_36655 [Candidatus Thorarchaeota archaeon]
MFECHKCGHTFNKPDIIKHQFGSGYYASIKRCPLCKHSNIIETKQKGEPIES